jgi:glutathione S-transferase
MVHDERFTEEFKALNPKKRVPVFKMGDEIITEVPAISTAISSLAPEHHFCGKTAMEAVRIYEWFNYLGGVVHTQAYGGLLRPGRVVEDPKMFDAVREKAKSNLEQAFVFIESKFRTGGTNFAVGNDFTAVDAYLFVLCRWARLFMKSWDVDFPCLSAWAGRILERKAVIKAMESHNLV